MSSRLVLIRHADVHVDPDVPAEQWRLSPGGARAAARLGRHPVLASVETIYSSPEPKALATAASVAHGRPVESVAALKELDRSGAGFLRTRPEYVELVRTIFEHPREAIHDCEPAVDAQRRITRAIDRLVRDYPERSMAIVSHGIALTLYVSYLRGLDRPDFGLWQRIRLPDLAVVDPVERRVLRDFGQLGRPADPPE